MRRIVNVKEKIIEAFEEDLEELDWNTLLNRTKVSKGALSKHLRHLIELHIVVNRVVNVYAKPSSVKKIMYSLNHAVLHKSFETTPYKEIQEGKI